MSVIFLLKEYILALSQMSRCLSSVSKMTYSLGLNLLLLLRVVLNTLALQFLLQKLAPSVCNSLLRISGVYTRPLPATSLHVDHSALTTLGGPYNFALLWSALQLRTCCILALENCTAPILQSLRLLRLQNLALLLVSLLGRSDQISLLLHPIRHLASLLRRRAAHTSELLVALDELIERLVVIHLERWASACFLN